ncbi:MAG: DUF58 domain-containing protein [Candidatus Koribacter versatilis]|uniref:DUF58 domain-containing protein n=1 Tax=Candidatus Korobacter versatilis TaxID=658062 RepID=A0A932A8E8_9BACT|nr:DUF58 domain-containing protein [Candidatus Koribacter versatilis]
MWSLLKTQLARIDRAAWVRFFVALAGLSFAFMAAVFSTIFREQGHLWVSALLASSALLMAGFVGLTVVPYLFRRVVVSRVRDAFDYDVTREGVFYLGIILVIAVAALNTGNNLLFIVVSAMLAAVLVSGVASASVLRGLDLDLALPLHVFAQRKVMARFTLHNLRRFFPSFSIVLTGKRAKRGERRLRWRKSVFAFPPKRPPERQWMRVPDVSLYAESLRPEEPQIFDDAVYFPYIPGGGSLAADVELMFPKRGEYQQDELGVRTRFPFSFLEKTRRIAMREKIVVYPRVDQTDELFEVLPMIRGEFEAFVRGRGNDLYRIREYLPEDSARHVDWKATAKSMSLKVREFTREDERKLRIIFDNPAAGSVPAEAYESAVELAASLSWHFAGQETELTFVAPGYSGAPDVYEFLHYLALVQPAQPGGRSAQLDALPMTDDYNVILTARPRGSIPTQLWATSYFVFIEDAGVRTGAD